MLMDLIVVSKIAYKAEEEERLAQMEEEARQAKLASNQAGISSQEREKIQQIVEQVGRARHQHGASKSSLSCRELSWITLTWTRRPSRGFYWDLRRR